MTVETRGLIGAEEFERTGEDTCVVNTARAAIADESVLDQSFDRQL